MGFYLCFKALWEICMLQEVYSSALGTSKFFGKGNWKFISRICKPLEGSTSFAHSVSVKRNCTFSSCSHLLCDLSQLLSSSVISNYFRIYIVSRLEWPDSYSQLCRPLLLWYQSQCISKILHWYGLEDCPTCVVSASMRSVAGQCNAGCGCYLSKGKCVNSLWYSFV